MTPARATRGPPRGLDLLVRGGTVVTMDARRRVIEGDVLVRDGRIVAVGRVPDGPGARVIEARGAAVIPGLVQAHVHLCQALFRGAADELPLMEWLRTRIWPYEAAHDERSLRASARLGLGEMLKGGTTTILDMGTVGHHDAVFEAIAESGMRAISGKAMMDRGARVPRGLRETAKESLAASELLATRWHGAEAGRIGYALCPRFILSCSEALFRGVAELAKDKKLLVHSHASEHRGERDEVRRALGKDDVDVLARWGIAGEHVVLAHGVQLTASQMKRMAKQKTRVVHCPSANLKLASGVADVVAMREAGVVVGLGADGAPCNNRMDAFTEMRTAALLAKTKRDDAAALSAMDVLAMATIDGARVLGLDRTTGSLEVGKRADLAVVRIDGLHAIPGGDAVSRLVYAATASDVTDVVVNGRHVVEARELRTMDEDAIRADALRELPKLLSRAARRG